MPIDIKIIPATQKGKKFQAIIQTPTFKRTIPFGQKGASDFTQHGDPERKANYIARHQTREDWSDPLTAGFFSRFVLWNKKSLEASKRDAINRARNILKEMGY